MVCKGFRFVTQAPSHCPLHDAEKLPWPHHPSLHHVSASDHLLELSHHYMLGQIGDQDQDGEDDGCYQGGGNLSLDGYEHCLLHHISAD